VWELYTNLQYWPQWGPSVRGAQLTGGKLNVGAVEPGATGTVTTVIGVELGFEVTRFEPGTYWAWKVAGFDATEHTVESLGDTSSRAGFGVGWIASPYLAVGQIALRRIKNMAEKSGVSS